MVLETLDAKKNDIFLYSVNKFDLAENFFLISKDEQQKYAQKIHFNDVCRYVADESPKSLLVYRLLTNIDELNASLLKYGFVVNVNGEREVIYFDPVYALKELENYGDIDFYPDLRFRIQQVGLISYIRSFGEPNFSEVYSFDLELDEVIHQNDKVFAEIIFAFDNVDFEGRGQLQKPKTDPRSRTGSYGSGTTERLHKTLLQEDAVPDAHTIGKIRTNLKPPAPRFEVLKPEKPVDETVSVIKVEERQEPGATFEKRAEELKERVIHKPSAGFSGNKSFSSFLAGARSQSPDAEKAGHQQESTPVMDLFRSSAQIKAFVMDREKKQVILKLKNP